MIRAGGDEVPLSRCRPHPGMPASDGRPQARDRAGKGLAPGIDTTVPASARIWNYWLGGKDHYPVDRRAAEACAQLYPGMSGLARSCRYFTARLVRFLAAEAGIRQFLDIGAGLPFRDNTHEIAEAAAPGCRVIYADSDPMVMAYARALLTASPPGSTDHIRADLNDPGALLDMARAALDFTRPVAVLLMQVLGHIGDPRDGDHTALAVAGQIKDALPRGGYLAISEITDTDPALNAALRDYRQTGTAPYHARRRGQIANFFEGLELTPPGIVPIGQWQPDPGPLHRGRRSRVGRGRGEDMIRLPTAGRRRPGPRYRPECSWRAARTGMAAIMLAGSRPQSSPAGRRGGPQRIISRVVTIRSTLKS